MAPRDPMDTAPPGMDEEVLANYGPKDSKNSNFRWTVKRRKFVYHIVRNGGHVGDAAAKAGLTQNGSGLMQMPEIQKAISAELRACLQKEGENSETIIGRWANLAQGNVADYFKMDQDGFLKLRDFMELSMDQQLRIKKVTANVNQYGQNVSLELHDVLKANDRLAELHGIIRSENTGMSPEEAANAIRQALAMADEVDGIDPPPTDIRH